MFHEFSYLFILLLDYGEKFVVMLAMLIVCSHHTIIEYLISSFRFRKDLNTYHILNDYKNVIKIGRVHQYLYQFGLEELRDISATILMDITVLFYH